MIVGAQTAVNCLQVAGVISWSLHLSLSCHTSLHPVLLHPDAMDSKQAMSKSVILCAA